MNVCFKGEFRVTSPYGMRGSGMHYGIDLVGIGDINVYAPCDGVIGASGIVTDKSDVTWEWGNFVRLDTSDGYSIFMCHLSSRSVRAGQKVKRGDKLGVMGCTGHCIPSGPAGTHTHFEVRKYGTRTRVNPAEFIGIPNKVGTYESRVLLESGNDIVWELMNNPKYKIEITEVQRAIKAIDKAKTSSEFMSLYWILYKLVNGNSVT